MLDFVDLQLAAERYDCWLVDIDVLEKINKAKEKLRIFLEEKAEKKVIEEAYSLLKEF